MVKLLAFLPGLCAVLLLHFTDLLGAYCELFKCNKWDQKGNFSRLNYMTLLQRLLLPTNGNSNESSVLLYCVYNFHFLARKPQLLMHREINDVQRRFSRNFCSCSQWVWLLSMLSMEDLIKMRHTDRIIPAIVNLSFIHSLL